MPHTLATISLLVREYDEAIEFFTRALRFRLLEDTPLGGDKRWVVVAPGPGAGANAGAGTSAGTGAKLLLARAVTDAQRSVVGNQSGGRVFLFLHTSEFDSDYAHMREHGVRFTEAPREEGYGRVVVFLDLYGNKWDLVQPR